MREFKVTLHLTIPGDDIGAYVSMNIKAESLEEAAKKAPDILHTAENTEVISVERLVEDEELSTQDED